MQTNSLITSQHQNQYRDHGFTVVRGYRDPATADAIAEHLMALRKSGPKPGDFAGQGNAADDPLNAYPRMINMGDWDDQAKAWSEVEDLVHIIATLLDDTPVLRQTMVYFKPPGSRGQGMHQDEQFINETPLVGAWLALDDCDERNGCMQVVPGSHRCDLLPVEAADTSLSFFAGQTVLPAGMQAQPVVMRAGDLLLFTGKTIHGSLPNTTTDRFRRAFICHFVGEHSKAYRPPEEHRMTSFYDGVPKPYAS